MVQCGWPVVLRTVRRHVSRRRFRQRRVGAMDVALLQSRFRDLVGHDPGDGRGPASGPVVSQALKMGIALFFGDLI